MIGSAEELINEIEASVKNGHMLSNPYSDFDIGNMSDENYLNIDLHKDIVDEITLTSSKGKPMKREKDIIDVWFDSGSMPYAQFHYPFENKQYFERNFPADFVAEGLDQTRGWFYTLMVLSTGIHLLANLNVLMSMNPSSNSTAVTYGAFVSTT